MVRTMHWLGLAIRISAGVCHVFSPIVHISTFHSDECPHTLPPHSLPNATHPRELHTPTVHMEILHRGSFCQFPPMALLMLIRFFPIRLRRSSS
jgi:hypothetical protein